MKKIFAILVILLLAAAAQADDCFNQVVFDADETFGQVFITYNNQCQTFVPKTGDAITIEDGDKKVVVNATALKPAFGAGTRVTAVANGTAALDKATLEQFKIDDIVTVTDGDVSVKAKVNGPLGTPSKVARYTWSLGPATKESSDGGDSAGGGTGAAAASSSTSDTNSAFRFKYDGEYATPGFFASMAKNPHVQTAATLSIDTTTTDDTGYIDNNRGTFGVRYVNLPSTGLFSQVNAGAEVRLSKAFHADVHDADAVATFSTWVPAIPAVTLLGSGPKFIAPPLTVALSYGYRNKHTTDENFHGRVGEATANYYLFAADKYMLNLSGTWTLNDLSNRPADVHRTQRLYKAQVSYLSDPAKGFEVAMSYENGSVGPLLTKVKQYFIGMALRKFSLGGGSK